jgi:hypothetical protein
LIAAILEAGGDALVRHGLHCGSPMARIGFLALGAVILFGYGVTVNAPPWDFGRLLGIYVTLFFLVAQVINWMAFGIQPTPPILVGGALIIAGGLTVTFWSA